MTLIHTPRVLWSVGKGLLKKNRILAASSSDVQKEKDGNKDGDRDSHTNNIPNLELMAGISPDQPPHVYEGRAGLFDVDYLGHMNNASSLTHAEYARWQWTAQSGMLTTLMSHNTHFMVSGAAIRFRRQIRPFTRKFIVETQLTSIDETNFWVYQTFRYPQQNNDRIRTQVLIKGVATKGRNVIQPRVVLEDMMNIPSDIVDRLIVNSLPPTPILQSGGGGEAELDDTTYAEDDDLDDATEASGGSSGQQDLPQDHLVVQSLLTSFQRLDECFRNAAAIDDSKR